jgi:hypothetical protein
MEQLYHLVEFLVQIVFVKHIYGLGHGRMQEGMVVTQDPKITRVRHGKDVKVKAENAPGLVLPRGPAHCPFSISARLKDTPVPHSHQSRSPCVETTPGFQF